MDPDSNWKTLLTEEGANRQKKVQTEQALRSEHRQRDDRLVVNVGGQVLETSRQTLCMDANSMLAAWVLRHLSHESVPLWIDRDEQRFKHVLNYLRNGTIWLQDVASLRALQEEADFYGLAGLHALCKEKIQNIEANEEAEWRRRLQDLQQAIREALGTVDKVDGPCTGDKRDKVTSLGRIREVEDPVFQMDADF